MRRIKFKTFISTFIICTVLVASTIFAKDTVKYNFDEVEVVYAAEFKAIPIKKDNDWLTDIAGGKNEPVKVLYGIVLLERDGVSLVCEEFIKVSGRKGTQRFLSNSSSYEYYNGTNICRSAKTLFWSAKRIKGSAVVKDFTKPIKSLVLYREYDENKKIKSFMLTTQENKFDVQGVWKENFYEGNLDTVVYSGDKCTKPEVEQSVTLKNQKDLQTKDTDIQKDGIEK